MAADHAILDIGEQDLQFTTNDYKTKVEMKDIMFKDLVLIMFFPTWYSSQQHQYYREDDIAFSPFQPGILLNPQIN